MLRRNYVVLKTLLAFLVFAQTMPVYATQAVKGTRPSNLPATVPFTSVSGTALILVSVSLDHGKPHLFLIDPGTDVCLIDEKFVKSEHLTIQKQVTTEKTEEDAVIPDQIVIQAPKPFSIPKVPFLVYDMSVIADPIRCPELVGLLGANFLNAFVEEIDFTQKSIVFCYRVGFLPPGKQVHHVLLDEDYSLPVEVDGQSTRGFISFMYPTTYLQDPALVAMLKPIAKIQAFSANKGTGNETLRLQSIRVEGMLWNRPVVDHSVNPVREENILGVDFFSRFYVTLDLSARQLYLELDPNYLEDTQRWLQTGFFPEAPAPGKLQVSYIYVPSPASEAGLKVGDTILAVNGMPVATTPLSKLLDANVHAATNPIRLKIQHEGEAKPKVVTVKARKLL